MQHIRDLGGLVGVPLDGLVLDWVLLPDSLLLLNLGDDLLVLEFAIVERIDELDPIVCVIVEVLEHISLNIVVVKQVQGHFLNLDWGQQLLVVTVLRVYVVFIDIQGVATASSRQNLSNLLLGRNQERVSCFFRVSYLCCVQHELDLLFQRKLDVFIKQNGFFSAFLEPENFGILELWCLFFSGEVVSNVLLQDHKLTVEELFLVFVCLIGGLSESG